MLTIRQRGDRAATIAAGGVAGLVLAGTLALTSVVPPAVADEQPFRTLLMSGDEIIPDEPLTAETFFKPNWTIEPSVNTDIVRQQTVRKIGYGQTEFVTVVTTPTGTYSSDAVTSPYVRYPGIHDTRTAAHDLGVIGFWNGSGWTLLKRFTANSFVNILPFEGGETFIDEGGVCTFMQDGSVYC
jgi:hypothetical protein